MMKLIKTLVTYLLVIFCMMPVVLGNQTALADEIMTWNIQGTTHLQGQQQTWLSVIQLMEDSDISIAAIQEAGSFDAIKQQLSGFDHNLQAQNVLTRDDSIVRLITFQYQANNYYVYMLESTVNDPNGKKIAIVLRNPAQAPNDIVLVHANDARRAALGVRLGNTYYFSVHANSPSNSGSISNIIGNIDNQRYQWVALGDWNLNLTQSRIREFRTTYGPVFQGISIHPPNDNTHNAKQIPNKKLDYAFSNLPNNQLVGGNVANNLPYANTPNFPSDHFPVIFTVN